MTADGFRKLALGFPGAVESAHVNHPDFRIGGRIFATLGWPDEEWGMVKLTPEQQRVFVAKAPEVFLPCNGAWGERGATQARLTVARKGLLTEALREAVENVRALAVKSPRKGQNRILQKATKSEK